MVLGRRGSFNPQLPNVNASVTMALVVCINANYHRYASRAILLDNICKVIPPSTITVLAPHIRGMGRYDINLEPPGRTANDKNARFRENNTNVIFSEPHTLVIHGKPRNLETNPNCTAQITTRGTRRRAPSNTIDNSDSSHLAPYLLKASKPISRFVEINTNAFGPVRIGKGLDVVLETWDCIGLNPDNSRRWNVPEINGRRNEFRGTSFLKTKLIFLIQNSRDT
jgi:hypothetical protein